MTFREVLAQVIEWLQQDKRVSYRALKMQFDLDDAYLEVLKEELIDAQQVAVDQDGRMLVWAGEATATPESVSPSSQPAQQVVTQEARPSQAQPPTPDAERRQLTVMFCDLVDSTKLSGQLDPEEYHDVLRAYQATCAEVIHRLDGYIAQHLGDALLVYFGYPQAHENDAQRAVHAGLGMLDAMHTLNDRLQRDKGMRLAIRIGMHTGLTIVGDIGTGEKHELLALGEAPNIASRIQGLAEPDTIAISDATHHLVQGYFTCQDLGSQPLKGVAEPMAVYRVQGETEAQTRFDVAIRRGLTPLVGREDEVALLRRRWEQSRDGQGQVVLLSGEGGIGKSRLVEALHEQVTHAGGPRIAFRCSAYHTNSALYPVIEHVQRLLQFQRHDTPETKLEKLAQGLQPYGFDLATTVPLLAVPLSVPLSDRYAPLTLTSQQQRQQTLDTLVAWLLEEAARQPVLLVVEDLHWADPSTLELLSLLIERVNLARMLTVCTFRPEFHPPWPLAAHLTQMTLNRFTPAQIKRLVMHVADGQSLPDVVIEQIVSRTDGIPLFVEELTKAVLESGGIQEREDGHDPTVPSPALAIPATLHDTLMARLDRQGEAKEVAQLGATMGRTFAYELLQVVSPLDEPRLQSALGRLVASELLTQRGVILQATYTFKHSLIQDAAYQSLLKSVRQQYHQQIARVLADQFPETAETQPEVLAHHFTQADLHESAVVYWQRAGQNASQRSAYAEVIHDLTAGLEGLRHLPDTTTRKQQELDMQMLLALAFSSIKSPAASEVKQTYDRAHALCRELGETPQIFQTLQGLWRFYTNQGRHRSAQELGNQLLTLAEHHQSSAHFVVAHQALGSTLQWLGEYTNARHHLEQALSRIVSEQHRELEGDYIRDPRVMCFTALAYVLWALGYPGQARQRIHEGLRLAQELAQPPSLTTMLWHTARIHLLCGEVQMASEKGDALKSLATEHKLAHSINIARFVQGWVQVASGLNVEGYVQARQGGTAVLKAGNQLFGPLVSVRLAEMSVKVGQIAEGLHWIGRAQSSAHENEQPYLDAEIYRVKGELLVNPEYGVRSAELTPEACFQKALDIARWQHAKSLELRAAMSLARLWQQQDKRQNAYDLLAPVYEWFTEGFDTADLQEANTLLQELA